ncbi:TPA: hypothetical protein ACWSD0_005281 [Escherichia coli]
MSTPATILDMCCGSRMFWFDKNDDRAIFSDIRKEEHTLCDDATPDEIHDEAKEIFFNYCNYSYHEIKDEEEEQNG